MCKQCLFTNEVCLNTGRRHGEKSMAVPSSHRAGRCYAIGLSGNRHQSGHWPLVLIETHPPNGEVPVPILFLCVFLPSRSICAALGPRPTHIKEKLAKVSWNIVCVTECVSHCSKEALFAQIFQTLVRIHTEDTIGLVERS